MEEVTASLGVLTKAKVLDGLFEHFVLEDNNFGVIASECHYRVDPEAG